MLKKELGRIKEKQEMQGEEEERCKEERREIEVKKRGRRKN